jgi:predicted DNA-binding transcriptional regulator YafY
MREDYGKFPELVRLIRFLATSVRGVTYDEIMQQFEWSRKTTERNLKFIENTYEEEFEKNPDAENRKIKRFKLGIPDEFLPENVEDADITALSAAITHIKNKKISEPLRNLQFKLMEKLKKKTSLAQQNDLEGKMISVNSIAAPEPKFKENAELVQTLESAILAGQQIIIRYQGNPEPLTLCPLGIVYGPINNYLIAGGNMDKENYSTYNLILDKIENLEVTKKHFDSRGFSLQNYVDKSFGAFHSKHGPYDVVWHVLPEAAKDVQRFIFHKNQKIKPNRDKSLTITMHVDGLREMAEYLLKWTGKIIPVAPQELIDEYRKILDTAEKFLKDAKKPK